jgi:hypothetical protein
MSLWTIKPDQDHDVYTVVYLLKDALRSALSDAWYFERTALQKADIKGAGHAEIAAKLGRFRDSCRSFEEREALMVTKVLRARNWAAELKRLEPAFQLDIDRFLDETEPCAEIQTGFLRDAQRMFNGGISVVRFLSQRKPDTGADIEAGGQAAADGPYLVGGRMPLSLLAAACDAFLSQIDGEFFSSEPAEGLPYFDGRQEPLLLTEIVH